MSELFEHLDRLRRTSGKVALATLVNTRGTTPRKEGAKMLVGEGGRVLGSVTIGGCVDAQVIEESASVLEAQRPRLLELDLGDEEAWEIGLTCGGTIEVFVEPVDLAKPSDETLAVYERLRAHAEAGGRGAVLTRLQAVDGDRSSSGAKMLLLDTGAREGTLGEAALDAAAVVQGAAAIKAGKSGTLTIEGTRVFAEVFVPASILLVVGAGHVAMPLVTLARVLGFKTVVIDGRPRFATRERFPDVDELKIGIPSELVQGVPLVPSTALVLVAHDYKYDLPVLRHALATPVGYVGLLGSSRRGKAILDLLREDGVTENALARVHVPIGLDLGAQSAPEIALAVLAEVLAVQRNATGLPLSEKVKRESR
jgi:xanthine dehydrogenase accessory factor